MVENPPAPVSVPGVFMRGIGIMMTTKGGLLRGLVSAGGMGAGLVVLAGLVAPATAQTLTAGFDCMEASTDVERIICSDVVLADRDARLGEAYKARRQALEKAGNTAALTALRTEQRAWLAQRNATCLAAPAQPKQKPEQSGGLDREQVWTATPCLLGLYTARLTQLGGETPAITPLPAGVWHPACVEAASYDVADTGAGRKAPGIDLTLCQAGSAHIPAESIEEGGGYSAEGAEEGFRTYSWYQTIGVLPTGRTLVLTGYNGGGTGTFNGLWAASVSKDRNGHDRLDMLPVVEGGDRCNGGLTDATIDGDALEVTRTLTPAALAQVLNLPEAAVDQVSDCAACCIAEMTTRLRDSAETPDVVSVSINAVEEMGLSDENPIEGCLAKVLEPFGGQTLTGLQVRGLEKAVAACAQNAVK